MRHSLAVLLVLLLAHFVDSLPTFAQRTDTPADSAQQEEKRGVSLGQNYPNPFRTETRIPFELASAMFEDGRTVVVSFRIFNLLSQHIATPTVLGTFAEGRPANRVAYDRPGRYEVLWNGKDNSGRAVASGIYFCEIVAGGSRQVIRMLVRR